MSDSKKYNSIVFLTTLSVYLGLVLVGGASSPVLAQAALTRNFEIQEEIEYKDDLDKKPDDPVCGKLKTKNDKSNNQFIEQYAEAILALMKQDYTSGVYGINLDPSTITSEFDELFNKLPQSINKDLLNNGFTVSTGPDRFLGIYKLKPKFENKDIASFADIYNASLNFLLSESKDKTKKLVLEHTTVSFENNQVFIITNLPRASIDSLLVSKDAK